MVPYLPKLSFLLSLLLVPFLGAAEEGCESDAVTRPNILLIAVDDLRPELKSFGAEYIHSPNIDALASRGVAFPHHYVQAPTCGASRYAMLTGRYGPYGNQALFQLAKKEQKNSGEGASIATLPGWFRQHDYTTVSVGKVSHHPGGRGGENWDNDSLIEMPGSWDRHLMPSGPWRSPRGAMHGLANGEARGDTPEDDVFQAEEGPDTIYPDGLIHQEALKQLTELTESEEPFFLAVGYIRPHLPFGAPKKYLDQYEEAQLPPIPHSEKPAGRTTWHPSGEFMRYHRWGKDPNDDSEFATEVRRHYAACVTYIDEQIGSLLAQLEQSGDADNTIIVLWGDHGWHLGEHALWGKHSLFEESLRSPLIVFDPHHDSNPHQSQSVVETVDIFPTLCQLASIPSPRALSGDSLSPLLANPQPAASSPRTLSDSAISYAKQARTIRTATHRLIVHEDGFCELYDHRSSDGETRNLAKENPELVAELLTELDRRYPAK